MPKLGMEVIRRRQVIDAAVAILSKQGWHDLTIREVSETANVSSGVITHYFSSKRAIIIDAISDTNQKFFRLIGSTEKKNADAASRLETIIDLLVYPERFDLPAHAFWIALYGRLPFDQLIQSELQRLQRWLVEAVTKIIKQGVQQGDFRAHGRAEDIAAGFVVMALGQIFTASAAPGDLPPERSRDLLLTTLSAMLGAELSGQDKSVARIHPVRSA